MYYGKQKVSWPLIIIAFFIGGILVYLTLYSFPIIHKNDSIKVEKEVSVVDNGISDAVKKLYDAVVVVETYKNKKAISSGSGFVYKINDDKAFILTNYHVIDGFDQVYITLTNGIRKEVNVVGGELYSDIAVLSINKSEIINVAEIGVNDLMKLGDTVFTIGAPIGSIYSGTVTRGILSGKDRMVNVTLNNSNYVMKVLQTDAAINSGNSGGPLANSNGEVIGITSLKLINTNIEGMGFAIPIEDAMVFATMIENNEKIERPIIGIVMIELNDLYNLARYNVIVPSDVTGIAIAEITSGSPADNAGLKVGDIIVKVAENNIKSAAEFRYQLYKHKPGDIISISILRNNIKKNVNVQLVASSN